MKGASRSLIRGRLVSALLVLGALGLILLAVIVSMVENVARKVSANVGDALGWQPVGFGVLFGVVVPAAVVFFVFVLLYRYLPHHRPGWRAALLGGGAAAIAYQAVQVGLDSVSLRARRLRERLRVCKCRLRVSLLRLPSNTNEPRRRQRHGDHPTMTELRVAAGVFAIGFLVFTLMLKVAVPMTLGEFQAEEVSRSGRVPAPA